MQKRNVPFAYIYSSTLEGEVYKLIRVKKVQTHVKFLVMFIFTVVASTISSCLF